MTRREPWERQPGETGPAWQAFQTYRDLGLTRSLTKAAQRLNKSRVLLGRWSVRWSWVSRAQAWDEEQDRILRDELLDASRKAARQHLAVASAMLTAASQAVVRFAQDSASLTPSETARFVETATRLHYLVVGEPTERLAVQGGGPDAPPVEVATLSDEERRSRMVALLRELRARVDDHDDDQVDGADPDPPDS